MKKLFIDDLRRVSGGGKRPPKPPPPCECCEPTTMACGEEANGCSGC